MEKWFGKKDLKISKFDVVEESKYGPKLQRKNIDSEENNYLRKDRIQNEEIDLSRRNFLKKSGETILTAGVIAGTYGLTRGTVNAVNSLSKDISFETKGFDDNHSTQLISDENKSLAEINSTNIDKLETVENVKSNERFLQEVGIYEALVHLRKDQVLFVDENNQPVGEPVTLAPFEALKHDADSAEGGERHLYTPGVLNEAGLIEGGIAGDWLKLVKQQMQKQYPDRKIAHTYHTTIDFEKAYNQSAEPDLVVKIANGEVEEYMDIVRHFADKPVVGQEQYSRLEYVRDMVKLEGLPRVIENEIRFLLPGLCAQESKFNADAESSVGAKGIMQIMPNTYEFYGGTDDEMKSLVKQVEIAGRFISDLHRQLCHHVGTDNLQKLRRQFSTKEDYQKDLLVPLIINSYNAGAACVAEGVSLYLEHMKGKELPIGKDLFIAIADFAAETKGGKYVSNYGKHAREYVPRIYAQAKALV